MPREMTLFAIAAFAFSIVKDTGLATTTAA